MDERVDRLCLPTPPARPRFGCGSLPDLSHTRTRTILRAPYMPGILSAVYVVGLLVCLVLGTSQGPNVFEKSPPDVVETPSLNVTWYGKIDGMERWHQVSNRRVRFVSRVKRVCRILWPKNSQVLARKAETQADPIVQCTPVLGRTFFFLPVSLQERFA